MEKLRILREKINALEKQLRDAMGCENPDAAKVEAIGAEIRSLVSEFETESALLRINGIEPNGRQSEAAPLTGGQDELRAAVDSYMRRGDSAQLRAMTSGTSGVGGDTGGYLIPESWENQILERERDLFVMRQLADVQMSSTDRNIPVADDYGASDWIAEGTAYPESDAKFATKKMEAFKVGRICKVSEELLQDNDYSLESWLINAFGYTNGLAMEMAYINGNGVGKPTGFLGDADAVAASGTALTYNHLLSLFKELKTGYYGSSRWLMNIGSLIEIMKLKDDSGAFLYKPFEPKTPTDPIGQILGKPIVLSSYMPDIGAGNKPIAFGDFKKYRIHDRKGFSIQRLNELFAANGFIGFRGMQRTDGKLLIPEAIKALTFAPAAGGGV